MECTGGGGRPLRQLGLGVFPWECTFSVGTELAVLSVCPREVSLASLACSPTSFSTLWLI